jgi:SsrA-binding protein
MAAAPKGVKGERPVAQNRRARHDYDIIETYECGLVLKGTEVKSLREGTAHLRDAFARVMDGEAWLIQLHIPPYSNASAFQHDPDRHRKLLLHRKQIHELSERTSREGLTLVPLSIYFKEGKAKLELALAKGRRRYDKRQAIAKRDAGRDAERALVQRRRSHIRAD